MVNSLAERASDNASRASATVFGTECCVWITGEGDDSVGPKHFELHVPIMGYGLEDRERLSP